MAPKFRDLFKPKPIDQSASIRAVEIFRRAQLLQQRGKLADATTAYRSILELHPDHWDALNAIAAIALQGGELEKAIQLYSEIIARKTDHAEAYYKRANALNGLTRWEAALADYDKAIAINPEYSNAYCNRGTMLERLKRWDEALVSYDRTIALNPGDYLAHYNRGTVLKELQRFDEALATYGQAIALKSDYVEAYINRGNVLQELRRDEAAVASYDRAIELAPIYAEAFEGRGSSLLKLRRIESAIASYDQAIALKPNHKYLLGVRRNAKMQVCDWDDIASDLERLAEGLRAYRAVCPPFPSLALVDSPALQRLAAEIFVREDCPPNHALAAIPARPRGDKVRIGYFSADFRNHPVSLLAAELFETHDRSIFEITAFAYGPESSDEMRMRLERAFDRFIDVRGQSDIEVALLARKLGIDIAVDLGGFTEYSRTRIFALRAAPIQINYLGYPGTMGTEYMDYLIGDRTVVPEAHQRHYTEKIIYLPHSYLPHDSNRTIADAAFTREEFGLPRTGFIFCCFNNSYKITPSTFDSWMRILSRTAHSVLWLSQNNPTLVSNLRQEASRRRVDPERLIFADRMSSMADHLARQRVADLFLDTRPYNAHTTAMDALWAGVPILTCVGEGFAGRVAASLLQAIDLPELITATPAQYEDVAVQFATNPRRMSQIRRQLADNRLVAPLFNTALFTKNLERAYMQIYERYHANLPPEHIYPSADAMDGAGSRTMP
jgi:predicted O-linked N-acetylglucosamine transferase (SPINDLY family)